VFEMARILTPGGRIIMVNDNVQYEGVEVAIDLLLANVAEAFGLTVEHIWMLEKGKGNMIASLYLVCNCSNLEKTCQRAERHVKYK